jgi:hypothetical protein
VALDPKVERVHQSNVRYSKPICFSCKREEHDSLLAPDTHRTESFTGPYECNDKDPVSLILGVAESFNNSD